MTTRVAFSTLMMKMGDPMRSYVPQGAIEAFFPEFPPERAHRPPARLWLWLDRRRQRVALGQLDGRLLADIGVSRAEADVECARWD